MRIPSLTLILFAAAIAVAAPTNSPAPDLPLIADGDIRVDAGDIDAFVERIPAERRADARASSERIATYADGVFVARSLGAKARALGLDKDPIVQRRLMQAQDNILADLYIQHIEKAAKAPELEKRARELYVAEPARFTSPEQVYVQHLLVNLNGRTRDMALERVNKIHAEAKAGEDFLSLAARYSDDPGKKKDGGDLGYNSPLSFVEPVRDQIKKMSVKGEISPPIESHQGFHIIRFVERKKPELAKFEDVRRQLIGVERDRLVKKIREDAIAQVRDSKTVVVHVGNLEKLVVPIDDVLKKAAAVEAAKAGAPK